MGSREERHRHNRDLVPLAALISRELKKVKMEKPTVRYGCAAQLRDCQRVTGNPSTSFSVLAIFDGHNGNAAAIFSRDHLSNYFLALFLEGSGRTIGFKFYLEPWMLDLLKLIRSFRAKA
ncbi:unnamed protein product [Fraxinus pennsylvanica]|uniref:PPM-type phosphatase domain-containing protein n=1 Tax=Fraxinus pennsylvanica TaxID=56036 RepID=A0AAD1Z656_9LAMI|nr:unnamed protein product [Fraxinus pennsylvanica]